MCDFSSEFSDRSYPFHDRGRYHMETSPLIASKSMDRFLYDIGLRHERVNDKLINSGHGGGGNEKEKQL